MTSVFGKIASPALRQTLIQGSTNSVTGFVVNTAIAKGSGASWGEAFSSGRDGFIWGFATGSASGFAQGYKYAKDNGLSPWSGKATTQELVPYYPANDGAVRGTEKYEYLMPGDKIDRYGGDGGHFFSNPNTPAPLRALPPDNNGVYNQYKVLKPIPVWKSTIAPAFNQPGGGIQYQSPVPVKTLIDKGFIIKF